MVFYFINKTTTMLTVTPGQMIREVLILATQIINALHSKVPKCIEGPWVAEEVVDILFWVRLHKRASISMCVNGAYLRIGDDGHHGIRRCDILNFGKLQPIHIMFEKSLW